MDEASKALAGGKTVEADISEVRVAGLLAQMSLEEKVSLLAGADIWSLPALERLGIPALVMSDGPAGVRGGSFLSGRSVSFPCETALAASWDPELVEQVGSALGKQARAMGVHVLLGPTVNLHRHPLAGRNFECFSEDPYLTAKMAVAYIQGVQANRVACCIKHLVCNDSEFERHTISSDVDPATLREMYLVPFERAAESGVWSMMASYNQLNGTHTSEHPWLLDTLLRDEWGFDGVVVSDWFATHSTIDALDAGLDVEMPGPARFRGALLTEAVRDGRLGEAVVDRSVKRVLRLIDRTAGLGGQRSDTTYPESDPAAVRSLVRRAGAVSMVLLKNDRSILPLVPEKLRTVALIGPGADIGVFQGGGSAQVNPTHVRGILPALLEALGDGVEVRFEHGCVTAEWPFPLSAPMAVSSSGEPGVEISYHLASDPAGPPISVETARQMQLVFIGDVVDGYSNDEVIVFARTVLHPTESGSYTLAMYGTGTVRMRLDGELLAEQRWETPGGLVFALGDDSVRIPVQMEAGVPRSLEIEFAPAVAKGLTRMEVVYLPPDPPDRQDRAVDLARRSDVAIVVAASPTGWESEGRDRGTMTLPGGQDRLIEAVAAANPNTVVVVNSGAPVAMPWADRAAAVLAMWFPGQEIGDSLADVLTGAVNPSGCLPTTIPVSEHDVAASPFYPGSQGRVVYGERSNFGYRYQPGQDPPKPIFAFGHGLSYSTFSLGEPTVGVSGEADGAVYEVLVPVTNSAGPPGRHVVQVYVSTGRDEGPALQLEGFASVDLDPGHTATARVTIPKSRLRWWVGDRWHYPPGPFKAWVGSSAADLKYRLELPATSNVSQQVSIQLEED